MEELRNKTHVIVAPSTWYDDPLRYRRHRLAEFLMNLKDTERVIWIAAKNNPNIRNIFTNKPKLEKLPNGIWQCKIDDFKGIIQHNKLLQTPIKQFFKQSFKKQGTNQNYYLWYTYPAFAELTELNVWDSVIYDCSDHWIESVQSRNSFLNKIKRKWIKNAEKKITRKSKTCFASSEYLQKRLFHLYGKRNSVLIENGVDIAKFTCHEQKEICQNSKPKLGFIGGLKPWKIDFGLLLEVFKKMSEWELVLIGSTYGTMNSSYEELIKLPNVKKYEPVAPSEIPKYIRGMNVGLLPYLNNEYNQGVFPLKFFEYLACGLPVVGCGLPSTKHYIEKDIYEYVDNDPNHFINACESAIYSNNSSNIERRITLAKKSDWNEKFIQIWEKVNV